jgi:hypothetical protein
VGRVSQRETEYETAKYPTPVAIAKVVNISGSQELLFSFLADADINSSNAGARTPADNIKSRFQRIVRTLGSSGSLGKQSAQALPPSLGGELYRY